MKFQDYYKTLGVERDASTDEINKAYRKLARKYHPDVNKSPGAEARFKEISEAGDVLKDEEKRQRYDTLGANWKNGQDFRPPPGFEDVFSNFAGGQQGGFGGGGFSDFFQAMFGEAGSQSQGGFSFRSGGGGYSQRGQDAEIEVAFALEEVYRGGSKNISLRNSDGGVKSYQVKVPPGVTDGGLIRLSGQGHKGSGGGKSGDLMIKLKIAAHPDFRVDGFDIYHSLKISPWEAALGTKVLVNTLEGDVNLNIPEGTQSGYKMRLKNRGLRKTKTERGNMYATVNIVVPKKLSEKEKALFSELASSSTFDPRA